MNAQRCVEGEIKDLAQVQKSISKLDKSVGPSGAPRRRYRTIWISDVHLGTRGCNDRLLIDFLDHVDSETLYLVGDSTMADKADPADNPEHGWGQLLPRFVDTTRLAVRNHAANGRSTKRFLDEGRWDTVMTRVRPGDYVLVQFAHELALARPNIAAPPTELVPSALMLASIQAPLAGSARSRIGCRTERIESRSCLARILESCSAFG